MDWIRDLLSIAHGSESEKVVFYSLLAALITAVATVASVVAIVITAVVAYVGINGGNREKRQDRAIALLRVVQGADFKAVMNTLQPFGRHDLNRAYHFDSWRGERTLDYHALAAATRRPLLLLQ